MNTLGLAAFPILSLTNCGRKIQTPIHSDGVRAVRILCVYGQYPTHGAPCRTRTCGPMIKSHVLEPTQLKAHIEARHFHNNYKQLSILQIGKSAYSLVRLSEDTSVGYWRSLQLLLPHPRIDFTPPQSKTTHVSL